MRRVETVSQPAAAITVSFHLCSLTLGGWVVCFRNAMGCSTGPGPAGRMQTLPERGRTNAPRLVRAHVLAGLTLRHSSSTGKIRGRAMRDHEPARTDEQGAGRAVQLLDGDTTPDTPAATALPARSADTPDAGAMSRAVLRPWSPARPRELSP